jgi:REP element-mobilizing transposase RayT
MARKVRLEYPGAIYHVINRGNYRAWIFREEGAKRAFTDCLFEACQRSEWTLHAFVVMGNHFHLAVETPLGNLVTGMQWLQSTFANRFNKLRDERGHLFQGRYKALLIEEGDALGQVCHYIHLNPVRAGIVEAPNLGQFRHSSYWYLSRPRERPKLLTFAAALSAAGSLPDESAGWRSYQKYLEWQAAEGPAGRTAAYVSMTKGWAIGTPDFKRALVQDQAAAIDLRAWEAEGAEEVQRARWTQALAEALSVLGRSAVKQSQKSAAWKVAVARHLKETTDVSNGWLAEQLEMGSHFYVSKHVGLHRRSKGTESHRLHALLTRKVKGKA